jgi:hypothetical protein
MNMKANGHVYVFLRSWFTTGKLDRWFKFPVVRRPQNGVAENNYIFPNVGIPTAASMIIDADEGTLQFMRRVRPGIVISKDTVKAIASECIDYEELVKIGTPLDFPAMFDITASRARYKEVYGDDMRAYFVAKTSNALFNALYTTLAPAPCVNCGGKNKRK